MPEWMKELRQKLTSKVPVEKISSIFFAAVAVVVITLSIVLPDSEEVSAGRQETAANVTVTEDARQAGSILYTDPETGYCIYFEDGAGILTESEEQALAGGDMTAITAFGSAGFISTVTDQPDTEKYAADRYAQLFGSDSGVLLVVNMERRVIALHCNGAVYQTINRNMADTITDNVYRKASEGNYYDMAAEAYRQVLDRLRGGRIPQPMKYVTNGLLAVILALLLNYFLVRILSASFRPSRKELLDALVKRENVSDKSVILRSTSRRYDPVQSSSSGSGGGGGGGGSSGGGGGSHSF